MSTEVRDLSENDFPEAVRVLCEGFPQRSAAYWRAGLERLAALPEVPNTVRAGHALFIDGTMRGIILTIPTVHGYDTGDQTFVNLSSWCVHAAHRGRAALQLYAQASSRHPDVIYTNLSAAAHTLPAVRASGFEVWTAGQLLCVGTRSSARRRTFVPVARAQQAGLSAFAARALVDHERAGCFCLCLETPEKLVPLIFLKRQVKAIPVAQLIFCEALADLVSNGLVISTWLAARGYLAMIVDANGPIAGLVGKYFPGKAPKFFKGPSPVLAVDHSYSEMICFGL